MEGPTTKMPKWIGKTLLYSFSFGVTLIVMTAILLGIVAGNAGVLVARVLRAVRRKPQRSGAIGRGHE